jgi:hypothetical protein
MVDRKINLKESIKKKGVFKLPKSDYPYYGQALGIIMMDSPKDLPRNTFTRIPGDVGNATTFNFSVQYKVMDWAVDPTKENEDKLVQAAKELESEGVRAIGTTCGFLSYFQPAMANAVYIPVFSSSLLQVPIVSQVIGKNRTVGIITFDSRKLTSEHFRNVGIDDSIPIEVYGMEMLPPNLRWENITELDPEKRLHLIEERLIYAANELVLKEPMIGAFVFECTNLPPGSAAVQKATGLPVFDVITLLNWAHDSVTRKRYIGFQ